MVATSFAEHENVAIDGFTIFDGLLINFRLGV